jgi:hypothetical protein
MERDFVAACSNAYLASCLLLSLNVFHELNTTTLIHLSSWQVRKSGLATKLRSSEAEK